MFVCEHSNSIREFDGLASSRDQDNIFGRIAVLCSPMARTLHTRIGENGTSINDHNGTQFKVTDFKVISMVLN